MPSFPEFVASTTLAGSAVATINLVAPATLYDGQILLAVVVSFPNTAAITSAPAGFSALVNYQGTDNQVSIYWKRATNETGGTYQFAAATSTFTGGYLASYRGASGAASPFDVIGTGASGSSTSATATAVTTTKPCRLIFVAVDSASNTMTPPAGMTERIDSPGYYLADGENYATGSTGTKTATVAVSDVWSAVLLALNSSSPTFTARSLRPAPFKPGLAR